jgi:hypothetical protein
MTHILNLASFFFYERVKTIEEVGGAGLGWECGKWGWVRTWWLLREDYWYSCFFYLCRSCSMCSKRLTVKRSHPTKEFVLSDCGTNTQHLRVLLLIIDFSRKLCSLVIITSFTSFKTFCMGCSAWNEKTWKIDILIINCTGRKKRDQKQSENTLGNFIHLSS